MEINTQLSGWRTEEKFEIAAISNNYKDILDDLTNSSDKKFLDWVRQIDKRSCNDRSEGSSISHSKKDYCLNNKDFLDTSLGLKPKT